MRSQGSRYSLNVLPAMSMEDILINSAESLLQLRDVVLARAEEEVARELVIRIPPSETLRTHLATDAIRRAREAEEADEEAIELASADRTDRRPTSHRRLQPTRSSFLEAVAIGDDDPLPRTACC